MRFLSVIALIGVSLFFPSIISAAESATVTAAAPLSSKDSSACIAGASSSINQSPSGASNVYEARFLTNQVYDQPSVKYPDNVDLHWSITDSDSKDSDASLQSFVVRIAHDQQMSNAHAIAVHQDGLYLMPGQRIRYWHSYSINGELCKTEIESFEAKEKQEETPNTSSIVSSQNSIDNNRATNTITDTEEEVELTESMDSRNNNVFESQQVVTPTAPPASPVTPTSPASPASPVSPGSPTTAPNGPAAPQQPTYPEPPATCANDEYFCQIYKNCYPCVANSNQPLCEQCNKVFACTDVNCRQKETCNLCKTHWNAYTNPATPSGPFVCSVVRGQC